VTASFGTARAALDAIPHGALIVSAPSCGAPDALLAALDDVASPERAWTLYSGLLLGTYPFLDAVRAGRLEYVTSHVMPPARAAIAEGSVGFIPVRATEINTMLTQLAAGRPLVALIRATPPGPDGSVSLGVSAGYLPGLVASADLVIAEADATMPFTFGDARIDADDVDRWVEPASPLVDYVAPEPDAVSDQIAERVLGLIPAEPAVQFGIGAIPEAISRRLTGAPRGSLRLIGMVTDAVVSLDDHGVLATGGETPPVWGIDLMGTERLWRWADRNPRLAMFRSERAHNPVLLAQVPGFTSINSAVEIDLTGQINAESVGPRQISGTGGSLDFVEAARWSPNGCSIVAVPSTVADSGASRIVGRLASGAAVTVPRALADVVVTEFGAATLRHRTVSQRIEALISIAHPDHRDRLADELSASTRKAPS